MSIVQNGNFTQFGSPVVVFGQGEAPSAALDWQQFAVVPGSYVVTFVEPLGGNSGNALHVITNGGLWPAAESGNGVKQSFTPTLVSSLTFSIQVLRGSVTAGAAAKGPFLPPHTFSPADGLKTCTIQVGSVVDLVAFETLNGSEAEYRISGVYAELGFKLPAKDVSQYVAYDPFWYLKDPGGPVERVRVANTGAQALDGPLQIVLRNH